MGSGFKSAITDLQSAFCHHSVPHLTLHLLQPVEHADQLTLILPNFLPDHHEPLVVACNVIRATQRIGLVPRDREWATLRPRTERRFAHYLHGDEIVICRAVEEFASAVRPERLASPARRNLPPCITHVRERPHVHFAPPTFVRCVGEPTTVG